MRTNFLILTTNCTIRPCISNLDLVSHSYFLGIQTLKLQIMPQKDLTNFADFDEVALRIFWIFALIENMNQVSSYQQTYFFPMWFVSKFFVVQIAENLLKYVLKIAWRNLLEYPGSSLPNREDPGCLRTTEVSDFQFKLHLVTGL